MGIPNSQNSCTRKIPNSRKIPIPELQYSWREIIQEWPLPSPDVKKPLFRKIIRVVRTGSFWEISETYLNQIVTIALILAPQIFRPSYGPVGILTALKIGNLNGCLCNLDVKKSLFRKIIRVVGTCSFWQISQPYLNWIVTITLILAPQIFRPSYGPLGILTALKSGNPNGCLCNLDVEKNLFRKIIRVVGTVNFWRIS